FVTYSPRLMTPPSRGDVKPHHSNSTHAVPRFVSNGMTADASGSIACSSISIADGTVARPIRVFTQESCELVIFLVGPFNELSPPSFSFFHQRIDLSRKKSIAPACPGRLGIRFSVSQPSARQ